jgi:hypothetical protein
MSTTALYNIPKTSRMASSLQGLTLDMLVPLDSPKASFTANATIFRKVDANAATPLTPLPHFWSPPSQVWPLSCFHPPPLDEGVEKISISSQGKKFFYTPFLSSQSFLLWYRRWRVAFLQSLSPLPPFHTPAFHPPVLKSWILSGLDLTYSFLFSCTSITFLKSRKGLGVTLILRRRDKGSVLLWLQVLSCRRKPRFNKEHFCWQASYVNNYT